MNLDVAFLRRCWPAALLGLLAAFAACGADEDDTPAVCSSVDDLRSSAAALTSVQVQRGALEKLEDDLAQVKSDLSTVVQDARSEFSDEVDAVDQATSDFGASLDAAVASPSAATVSEVRSASKALGSSLNALVDAVDGTC